MCGISGYFSVKNCFETKDLLSMVNIQAHRGPDHQEKFEEGFVGLGHNRLSILDLSENGNQPMISANGRFVIVYNGEVYNFLDLLAELKASKDFSMILKSYSDTEIILEYFSLFGKKVFSRMNGMFSLAIYDRLNKELVLARDPSGIKPLFYYWDGDKFAFSSELKALKANPKLNLRIQVDSIPHYLHLGFIPAPFSIYKNCYKLEAGNFLVLNENGIEINSYSEFTTTSGFRLLEDSKDIIRNTSKMLDIVVRDQMVCDVPFGVFLSGGVDSSLLAAKACENSKTKIKTFTIGFEDLSQDESKYARKIASHLGTDHSEFILRAKDAVESLPVYQSIYDEPFADSSGIPTLLLSKMASQSVKVVLSGEGADELFFGYGAYRWAKRFENPILWKSRKLVSKILDMSGNSKYMRAARMFNANEHSNLQSHIFSQEQYYFSKIEILDFLKPDIFNSDYFKFALDFTNSSLSEKINHPDITLVDKQSFYDLLFYLPDDLLVKLDRAGMKFSLEARVPYLDNRIKEYMTSLPAKYKTSQGHKFILRSILSDYFPTEFFQRPKKGFSVPMKSWLKHELKSLVEEFLSEAAINSTGIFDFKMVNKLTSRFYSGEDYLSQRIWLILNLQMWLKSNS